MRLSLDGEAVVLANEFASVLVRADDTANGPRLWICDPSSGRQIYLDPLELQALAWARHEMLDGMLQPRFKEEQLTPEDLGEPVD